MQESLSDLSRQEESADSAKLECRGNSELEKHRWQMRQLEVNNEAARGHHGL